MDKFYVVIYDTDKINISIEKRAKWIKDLYPNVNILYAKNPPSRYGLDKDSVKIQMEYLSEIIKGINPTYFYSSELYGKCVSDYLNINERQVDIKRENFKISSSVIMNDIESNKCWISDIVYKELKK